MLRNGGPSAFTRHFRVKARPCPMATARRAHWVYLPGPAMRQRLEGEASLGVEPAQAPPAEAPARAKRLAPTAPTLGQMIRETRTLSSPNQDTFSADRSLDPQR